MNIEKYLVLNKYLLSLFGVSDFRDLQEKLKDAPVGVDSNGKSHFINVLRSSFENLKLPEDLLLRYDENIQFYAKKINYYQFFHYNLFSPDNIILITPNEGLSKQHFEELQKSGIPCLLYAGSLSALGKTWEREILVIEMTKFVEEKKGETTFPSKDEYIKHHVLFLKDSNRSERLFSNLITFTEQGF